MKLNKIIISLVACLSVVLAGQAATTNILDWTFSTAPTISGTNQLSTPNPGTSTTPGDNPLATFIGANATWYFSLGSAFGPPTGLWDMEGGAYTHLSLDLAAAGPVTYTLQIWQFADQFRSFYPGALNLPTSWFVNESVAVPQSGGMSGSWYEDTYSWSDNNANPVLSLDIKPGAQFGSLIFDEVRLTIVGELGPVPEPSCGLIMVAGLLGIGIRSWLRRKV